MAKSDKQCIRELLDMVRYKVRMISQFDFIAICVKAFVKVKSTYWVKSFFKVNLHPDFHIDFVDWLKRIDKKVQAGERFFKPFKNSLLESMPALWQKLSCEARYAAVSQIDTFYECALPSESVWKKKENLCQLQNYCSIEHISHATSLFDNGKKKMRVYFLKHSRKQQQLLPTLQLILLISFVSSQHGKLHHLCKIQGR